MLMWEINLELSLPVGDRVRLLTVVMGLAAMCLNSSPGLCRDYAASGKIMMDWKKCERLGH